MRVILAALALCACAVPARAEVASCYGRENHQLHTATGENYNPWGLTAAHRTVPFGTRVRVCNARRAAGLAGGGREPRCITVTINDRGPAAWTHRDIDLSLGACRAIGSGGIARVFLTVLNREKIYGFRHHRHRRRCHAASCGIESGRRAHGHSLL